MKIMWRKITKEILQKEYLLKPVPQIAKKYKVGMSRVFRKMDRFGIKRDHRYRGKSFRGADIRRNMSKAQLGKIRYSDVTESEIKKRQIAARRTWKKWKPDISKAYKTRQAVKKVIRNWFNIDHCTLCGWKEIPEILHLHHKDGNHRNNTIKNCTMLCPNCHNKVHYAKKS